MIVDLAADFRLHDPSLYPIWYGADHAAPTCWTRSSTACPSCTVTSWPAPASSPPPAAIPPPPSWPCGPWSGPGWSIVPGSSTSAGSVVAPLIVDAASGVSGAGRAASDHLHFGSVDEDFVAYGLLDHRHTAEMEQSLGAPVLFTPHLAPMVRGILATCYGRTGGPAAGGGRAGV